MTNQAAMQSAAIGGAVLGISRRLTGEDRWRLESQASELVQGADGYGLTPLLDLLLDIHAGIVDGRRMTDRRCRIVEGLYSRLVGPWGL